MKKSPWVLLIAGGLASLLLIGGAGAYFFRYLALDRKYEQEGKAYLAQKNYPKAIETYTKLAKIHPESMAAYAGCGRAYYSIGRYDDAVREFGHAIFRARLEKNKAYCYTWRGICYASEKMWDAAIDNYTNAILRDPQHWNAYRLRGKAYGKKRGSGWLCATPMKRFESSLNQRKVMKRGPLSMPSRGSVIQRLRIAAKQRSSRQNPILRGVMRAGRIILSANPRRQGSETGGR